MRKELFLTSVIRLNLLVQKWSLVAPHNQDGDDGDADLEAPRVHKPTGDISAVWTGISACVCVGEKLLSGAYMSKCHVKVNALRHEWAAVRPGHISQTNM